MNSKLLRHRERRNPPLIRIEANKYDCEILRHGTRISSIDQIKDENEFYTVALIGEHAIKKPYINEKLRGFVVINLPLFYFSDKEKLSKLEGEVLKGQYYHFKFNFD